MNFNPNRRVPIRIITVYHPPLSMMMIAILTEPGLMLHICNICYMCPMNTRNVATVSQGMYQQISLSAPDPSVTQMKGLA